MVCIESRFVPCPAVTAGQAQRTRPSGPRIRHGRGHRTDDRIGIAIRKACDGNGLPMPLVAVEVTSHRLPLDGGRGCRHRARRSGHGAPVPLPDVELRPFRPHVELTLCLIYLRNCPRSRLALRFAEGLRAQFLSAARSRGARIESIRASGSEAGVQESERRAHGRRPTSAGIRSVAPGSAASANLNRRTPIR